MNFVTVAKQTYFTYHDGNVHILKSVFWITKLKIIIRNVYTRKHYWGDFDLRLVVLETGIQCLSVNTATVQ